MTYSIPFLDVPLRTILLEAAIPLWKACENVDLRLLRHYPDGCLRPHRSTSQEIGDDRRAHRSRI